MDVNGGSVAINIEGLASSIEVTMSHDLLPLSPKCCIFKTPNTIQRQKEKAFIPAAFSFGPLHHGHLKLNAAENIKAMYLRGLISRLSRWETRKEMLVDFIASIKAVEKEAREYYGEPINYTSEEFVKMLVIDGCFIIEVFRKGAYEELREKDDPIFTASSMLECLYHDLILVENQVPWNVLERLFNMTMEPRHNEPLTQLAVRFMRVSFSIAPPPSKILPIQDVKHVVDLLRKWLISFTAKEESKSQWRLIPSVTTLVEAGVKFRKGTSESILDIEFSEGILKIPPLLVHEISDDIFRNLIAYEQCHPGCEARLTSYAIFMDNLINTTNDLDILCENEIVDNWLNPEDSVRFFNKLYHNAFVQEFYYGSLCNQVNRYCQRRWPRWRSVLVRNYFNTPWAILSTLAAVILLILSFLQTWYTIKN